MDKLLSAPYRPVFDNNGVLSVHKFASADRAIDLESKTIRFVVSTATPDRDGDIVSQDGWNVERFNSNPVVLWAHDYRRAPIAKATRTGVVDGALKSSAVFMGPDQDPFSHSVFQMYQGGFMNAVSAGFEVAEYELYEDKMSGRIGVLFKKQNLLEYSCVPVPANGDALVEARSKGLFGKEMQQWVEKALDERAFPDHRDLMSTAYIKATGRVHPSVSADLAEKNFGATSKEHDVPVTKEELSDIVAAAVATSVSSLTESIKALTASVADVQAALQTKAAEPAVKDDVVKSNAFGGLSEEDVMGLVAKTVAEAVVKEVGVLAGRIPNDDH